MASWEFFEVFALQYNTTKITLQFKLIEYVLVSMKINHRPLETAVISVVENDRSRMTDSYNNHLTEFAGPSSGIEVNFKCISGYLDNLR